jgi:hypothetical protein
MVATTLIATLEGAIMMSNLYHSSIYIRRTVAYLTNYITTTLRGTKTIFFFFAFGPGPPAQKPYGALILRACRPPNPQLE